ncbi:MAG TPA: HAD-IA family hydrolase [Burkholderiales bacterium]|jgi:phosphoglycolate phosphatase|nr:HAD-IA family hydrolase [Burkholderiales bacterium]
MARRFDLLVFDWDGTLVDSAAHIVSSLQSACRDLDLPIPSERACRHVIGLGLQDAVRYVLPGLPQRRLAEVAQRYALHYQSGEDGLRPFPMVEEGLLRLQKAGHLLAIATGKSRRGLDRILATLGMRGHFVATRCADEGLPKPHPDMLQQLMQALSVPVARTLMIGDTTHDLLMALNAGASAVAVTYGAHPPQELARLSPLACVASFAQLLEWLENNA